MPESQSDRTVNEVVAENSRLRKLAELLHDIICPAEYERFPQLGDEICRVLWMNHKQQTVYWYSETCKALGLPLDTSDVLELNTEANACFIRNRPGAQ